MTSSMIAYFSVACSNTWMLTDICSEGKVKQIGMNIPHTFCDPFEIWFLVGV